MELIKMLTVDDFNLIRVVGKGGFSKVYPAKDQQLDQYVAIKIIKTIP